MISLPMEHYTAVSMNDLPQARARGPTVSAEQRRQTEQSHTESVHLYKVQK